VEHHKGVVVLVLDRTGLGPADQAQPAQMAQAVPARIIREEEVTGVTPEGLINRATTAETSLVGPHQETSIQEINIGLIMTRPRRQLLVLIRPRVLTLVHPLVRTPMLAPAPNRQVLALKATVNHRPQKIGRRPERKQGGRRS
jgi:hypothetical protein